MPHKPRRPCLFPGCSALVDSGYCPKHRPNTRVQDARPSAAVRGYDRQWQMIRADVLKAHGIPVQDWPLYDVHHEPDYDPDIEPDHHKYTLTPLLHGHHSAKTGQNKWRGK